MDNLYTDSYWTKGLWRNKLVYQILRPFIGPFMRVRCRFHFKHYTPKDRTFLLLTNHNSTNDHFLNVLALGRYMRFVVSDHLMRKGFLSSLLKFLVNPIPRRKGMSGDLTIKLIKQNLSLGIPVIMYAEGNRSFNGRTGFISPRTGQLVKDASGSLITYRIDGAYMQTPRWGHTVRRGPTFGTAVNEYSREELNKMSAEEIYAHICEDLSCDAYAYQRQHGYKYKSKAKAEYLETTLFVCPACGKIGGLKSSGDAFGCECGMQLTVNDEGFFEGENVRFDNVYDWDMWQRGVLSRLCGKARGTDKTITKDAGAILYRVNGDRKEKLGENLTIAMRGDRLEFTGENTFVFPLDKLTGTAVAHTSVLFFTHDSTYYEARNASVWPANKYFALHRMLCGMKYV